MADDADELRRIEDFLTRMHRRVSERVVDWRGGIAYLNERLSKIWDVNFLELHNPTLTAEDIASDAEEVMGAARCLHRRVRVRDPEVGAALEPVFAELGWETDVHVIMSHRRKPDRIVDTSTVEELGDATWPSRQEQMRTYTELKDDETVRQMRAFYDRAVEAASGRDFGIVEDGKVVSFALLYSDGASGGREQEGLRRSCDAAAYEGF